MQSHVVIFIAFNTKGTEEMVDILNSFPWMKMIVFQTEFHCSVCKTIAWTNNVIRRYMVSFAVIASRGNMGLLPDT